MRLLNALAFLILLLMVATETEYYSFYVVCLVLSGMLIAIDKRLKIKDIR